MIRPLRRAHLLAFCVLALLLPILFIVGLVFRRPIPRVEQLPGRFPTPSNGSNQMRWESKVVGGQDSLDLGLLRKSDAPDPLVYWSREKPSGNEPGNNAVLLGALSSWVGMGSLSPAGVGEEGYLIIYSLAQKRVVAVRPWRKGAGQ